MGVFYSRATAGVVPLNSYTTKFFATCPNNGVRIEYTFNLRTQKVVQAEAFIAHVSEIQHGYHEQIADDLHAKYGDEQTLTADHHGVFIETYRR